MELYLLTVLKESEFEHTECDSRIYSTFDSALVRYDTEVDAAKEAYNYGEKCEDEVSTNTYRYYEIYNPHDAGRIVITIEKKILND